VFEPVVLPNQHIEERGLWKKPSKLGEDSMPDNIVGSKLRRCCWLRGDIGLD
jgi:hypothetical protein